MEISVIESKDWPIYFKLRFKDEKFEPLSALFYFSVIEYYPDFIEGCINGTGCAFNDAYIVFPKDAIEDGLNLSENSVIVGIFKDQVQVSRIDFLELLLKVAKIVLKVHTEKGKANDEWINKMNKAIINLEDYIKNPDFNL